VALALDPNDADAWTDKGSALWGLKRYDEALVALDRAWPSIRIIQMLGTARVQC